MYPQEVLQREHLHTVVLSYSIAMFSRLHISPRDLQRGHMQTYILSCSIAMFPVSMYPQEIFNGDTNRQSLCPALISRFHVSPRDSSTRTRTHAILTRHHVRNQITMTSLQISVTLLTSLMMMCCFTFPVQIV